MTAFRWNQRPDGTGGNGETYKLVEDPLMTEGEWIERQCGVDLDDMPGTMKTRAMWLVSLKRGTRPGGLEPRPVALSWEDTQAWRFGDFTIVADPDEAPPAPPEEAGDPPALAEDDAPASASSDASGG